MNNQLNAHYASHAIKQIRLQTQGSTNNMVEQILPNKRCQLPIAKLVIVELRIEGQFHQQTL